MKSDFVPKGQQVHHRPVKPPPIRPLPRICLLINRHPSVITPSLPKIRIPPLSAGSLSSQAASKSAIEDWDLEAPSSAAHQVEDEERSDEGDYWADRAEEELWGDVDDEERDEWDEEDIRAHVDRFAADSSNVDESDSTEEMEKGPQSRRPDYQFCPTPHRLPIMRLFAKHASQHPLLPERHGEVRTAANIRRDAVEEMYRHCEVNNLREVWAYLWNSWYLRERWPLWARAAYSCSIPCKRMTMMVEALWRNLKRLVLHLFNRPPVDLATHAIITKAIPPYRVTLS